MIQDTGRYTMLHSTIYIGPSIKEDINILASYMYPRIAFICLHVFARSFGCVLVGSIPTPRTIYSSHICSRAYTKILTMSGLSLHLWEKGHKSPFVHAPLVKYLSGREFKRRSCTHAVCTLSHEYHMYTTCTYYTIATGCTILWL